MFPPSPLPTPNLGLLGDLGIDLRWMHLHGDEGRGVAFGAGLFKFSRIPHFRITSHAPPHTPIWALALNLIRWV